MIPEEAQILRVFLGESDLYHHVPVYEQVVLAARKSGLAGATVMQGIMGYGRASRLHTSKILRLSEDLPIIIEIIDAEDKIRAFLPELQHLLALAGCGGLITMEKTEVIAIPAE